MTKKHASHSCVWARVNDVVYQPRICTLTLFGKTYSQTRSHSVCPSALPMCLISTGLDSISTELTVYWIILLHTDIHTLQPSPHTYGGRKLHRMSVHQILTLHHYVFINACNCIWFLTPSFDLFLSCHSIFRSFVPATLIVVTVVCLKQFQFISDNQEGIVLC